MEQSIASTLNQQPTFEDLELLVEVSQLLTLRDLGQVMGSVMDLAASAVGASKASIFLQQGQTVDWNYVFTARDLEGEDFMRVVNQVMDKGLAGWVVSNKVPAIVADTETDDRWHIFPDDKLAVRSAMCVPLMLDNQVIAVLTLVHPEPKHFNDYHMRLMTIIANQATVAIRNTQLFQNLQEKREQLQAVLQSVPDVMLVLNEKDEIIHINDNAKTMLNVTLPVDALGKPLSQFSEHADLLERIYQHLTEKTTSLLESTFEMRSYDLEKDYVITISGWEQVNTERHGHVILIHDVTTLKNLFRFKDEMLRIVSHDLRSPLSIISGYADMVEYDVDGGSHLTEYTGAIKRSVTRMSDLLEDLLKVRQIDEKGLDIDPEALLIDAVLPVIQGASMLAFKKDHNIISDVQIDDEDTAELDTTLIRQAMENFASNAVKYTPEGGTITLRAYTDAENFHFEVEDSGIGIPEESLPHLFESFYRVNPDLNTTVNGAGLGLSLVKSIIERHRGQVWVKSEEGKGSTFGLHVPLKQQ